MHKYGELLGICTCSLGSAYNSFLIHGKTYLYISARSWICW